MNRSVGGLRLAYKSSPQLRVLQLSETFTSLFATPADPLPINSSSETLHPSLPSTMSVFLEAFANKWFRPALPQLRIDLTGRIVIVTGSNGGLGLEAAKAFYSMHPRTLILAVRSASKGEEAKKQIMGSDYTNIDDDGGNNNHNKVDVQVWPLDLGSFDSVKEFAARANKELDRLDILLENAGVGYSPYVLTNDGWENS